jgi:hypothetical protein
MVPPDMGSPIYKRLSSALIMSGVAVVAASCNGGLGGLGTAACPQMRADVDALGANYSADARANAKIRAFMQAAKDIAAVSVQVETMAADACLRMGTDLGLRPDQMQPVQGPGGRAKGACDALALAIDGIFRQGIQVRASATPPQCQMSAEAEARCQGACNVQVDPGQIVASCEPAKLSGFCQGTCTGQCDGRCSGQCNGQCTAYDAQGRCAGQCQGTCNGSCDATCHAGCQGQWQAPRCEGQVTPPSADAECNASCRAHANVQAQCTPAVVQVQVSQNVDMAARLAATLQRNLPQLLHAQLALGQRLMGDVQVVVDVGAQLPRLIGNAGMEALACVAAASEASVQASASIKVSVQASASVSGRVGASGGT